MRVHHVKHLVRVRVRVRVRARVRARVRVRVRVRAHHVRPWTELVLVLTTVYLLVSTHLGVVLVEAHLHVEADELAHVAVGERVLRAEDRSHLYDGQMVRWYDGKMVRW